MGWFDKSMKTAIGDGVGEGVRKGLDTVFGEGGKFSQLLEESLKPFRDELVRLRRLERRLKWHPIADIPSWALEGCAVLVSCNGEMMWAAYVTEPNEEPYWDRDLEYGGTPISPTHFFLLPKPPPPAEGSASSPSAASASAPATDDPKSTPNTEDGGRR